MNQQNAQTFAEIRERLDEIVRQVRDDNMPLDSALDLYDEAVKLGMKATEMLEVADKAEQNGE